jgi:hypothetical protein
MKGLREFGGFEFRVEGRSSGRGRQDTGRFRVNWMALIACWDPLKRKGQRCQQTTETRFVKYHVRPRSTEVSTRAKAGNLSACDPA